MALNFRIGVGIYSILDYRFILTAGRTEPMAILMPTIAAGFSFQWRKGALSRGGGHHWTHNVLEA
ncbi:MAG: hypothetical protein LBF60_08500 [Treponema sp.]|jgi:hypothetical protein|nr:hypothetical protein [Treponema sp.]